jgi:hypothetical protein
MLARNTLAMLPTSTRKKGRLYRYYACMQAIHSGHETCPLRSFAAGEIEAVVIAQVWSLFEAPEIRARDRGRFLRSYRTEIVFKRISKAVS